MSDLLDSLDHLMKPTCGFSKTSDVMMEDSIGMIYVDNEFATAKVSLYGGSVLSFVPKGQEDVLWVSPTAKYDGEKPIRGGIPICWPWFGKAEEAGLPAHGFVRSMEWEIDSIQDRPTGETEINLYCEADEWTQAQWDYEFYIELQIVVGEKLTVALRTINVDDKDLNLTEAMHSYFNVADVNHCAVSGLVGATSYDTLQSPPAESLQQGLLSVSAPIDSVFTNQVQTIEIEDPVKQRSIVIEKQQSKSAIVWNAGPEIVKNFADIPDDAWPSYLCVEAGNVFENALTLLNGEEHTLTMTLSIKT